ncbi:hypothetical protein KC723_03190 [Candidatus Kaiserbacteria bacterium]|nr:hypothetical protein [Candidatus Kaiserbacteria bacterium]
MSKNILIGVVAFGGIAIVSSLVFNGNEDSANENYDETVSVEEVLKIPGDISSQFPIYQEAELDNLRDIDGDTARDLSLSLVTNSSIKDVNDWYRSALSTNGWSIKSDKNVAGYQIIQGENNNLYTSMQAANGTVAGTVVISQHLKIRKE